MKHISLAAMIFAAICAVTPAFAAEELLLAEGGKSFYAVSFPGKPNSLERQAVADLRSILGEITGAEFPESGKEHNIFVGVVPPCDTQPLAEDERRITSCNGDIYLYGVGTRANVNAVYDFLRDVLGCRFFTVNGDNRIPKAPRLALDKLERSLKPSIPFLSSKWVNELETWRTFARRINLYDFRENFFGEFHAGQRVIPSGRIAVGKRIGNTFGPPPCFADRKYFADHPEWFSMDRKGKRVISMQLCYSNRAMRDEYERNLGELLALGKYDGRRAIIGVGQEDNGDKFCYCPDCEALEKKYGHPAGPYYDFLIDLAGRFGKKYPKVLLCFLAYREEQTLRPAKCMTKLPENLLPSYAPLGADFSKPFTNPVNRKQKELFGAWAAISTRLHWWVYPTTYPRPVYGYPLTANIHRLAENFRFAHRCKVWHAFCEFGDSAYGRFGFNDLRTYMLSELCRRIDADEATIIREFTDEVYGAAAPGVRRYLAELEKLEAESPYYLRWNPDFLTIRYATPARVLRWEREFDAMETQVAGDTRRINSLRRLRFNLDQYLLLLWQYLTPAEKEQAGDVEKVIARAQETVKMDASELRVSLQSNPAHFARNVGIRCRQVGGGLDQIIASARGAKPLPAQFMGKKFFRLVPCRNKMALDADPEAPFGLCCPGMVPKSDVWVVVRSFEHGRDPEWRRDPVPKPITFARLQAANALDGKYHYHHLGAMPVLPDAQVYYGSLMSISGFGVGHFFDPKRPGRLFDFYVALAVDPATKRVKVGELVVIPLDRDAANTGKAPAGTKDTTDAFI